MGRYIDIIYFHHSITMNKKIKWLLNFTVRYSSNTTRISESEIMI